MSRNGKGWESRLSLLIPYMSWSGLQSEARHSWTTARHSHAFYELHIILDGTCSLVFDTVAPSVKAGQAVIIAPNVFHSANNVSSPFCRFSLTFSVNQKLLDAIGGVDEKGHLCFDLDDKATDLCHDILTQIDSEPYLHHEYTSALLSQLIILCLRSIHVTVGGEKNKERHLPQGDEHERIDYFFAMFPPERQTREELAAYLHCSPRQLNRKMQSFYGTTFQKKLIATRVNTAQYLLRTTDFSVNEVSSQVGYANNAAFYRIFRQYTGITPAQYREEKRLKK